MAVDYIFFATYDVMLTS